MVEMENLYAHLSGEFVKKRFKIFHAFIQGGQSETDDTEAVKKIGAELPGGHFFAEILMCGRG